MRKKKPNGQKYRNNRPEGIAGKAKHSGVTQAILPTFIAISSIGAGQTAQPARARCASAGDLSSIPGTQEIDPSCLSLQLLGF